MDLNSLAKNLNLAAIGIAPAEDLKEEYDHLLNWILHGYHGKMDWLAKSAKRRCFPSHILAEPKSVIVAAMKYDDMPKTGDTHLIPTSELSVCPQYLQHQDYHEVMMEKLEAVTQEIKKEHPSAKFKCYVDTGPVLEKAWAVKAGLGFIGKNTLLISPTIGSQIALGVIITDIPNDMFRTTNTKQTNKSCETCSSCIDACPTKAIIEPYLLDARKCISYKFFIEKREGGCDRCQDVCPYNKENL